MGNEDKRKRLIDAAYKVFVKKGFTNASIKDIAKEADITPGLVHYYFKNKEELLFSVQNQVQQQYHKNYDDKNSSLSPMNTLQEIKSRAEKDPDWYRWRYELYSLGLKNVELQQEVSSILKKGRESLSIPLQTLVSHSEDTNEMASILVACFDGLALQKIVDDNFEIDRAYDLLLKLLEIYLKK
ncbi:TetR/AcrR family transcriptional regulator [Psychrobacillus vulpis]|uniref:TetR/AcrR family transcriptional regulator n=1 Tax=Psychrobacillus vulpis TaxID=2325572 RepID=A0A544TV14_9BACI|nr:TetR/AcrR family transcriptional regulator [Psychrobacillus vulpis]TQR21270.1 TetR/AcrR family transcriptional regulator [Psychrobacillus vulpis]